MSRSDGWRTPAISTHPRSAPWSPRALPLSHPATYGPRGGTAAAVRQTCRSTGCYARTGGAHGERPAEYVPPPRPPRLGPQRIHPPTRGQPQPITVSLCGDKPPQSKCVVSRDTMVRSGATAHTAPQTAVLRWPWAAPVCWLVESPMQPGRRIPQPSQFPAGVPLRARVGDLAFASLHSSQGPIPMAVGPCPPKSAD